MQCSYRGKMMLVSALDRGHDLAHFAQEARDMLFHNNSGYFAVMGSSLRAG